MDDAKYLEQKRAQIQNLRDLKQMLLTAQENLDKAVEERKSAEGFFCDDDFERATEHLDYADNYLKLTNQKLEDIQKIDKLTKAAEQIEMQSIVIRDSLALEQETVHAMQFKNQWLMDLDVAIKDADSDQNWELYRRYVLDGLEIRADSTKFVAYDAIVRKIYVNVNSGKSNWSHKRK